METRVLFVKSTNLTPERELEERIAPFLSEGFRVANIHVALAPHGEMDRDGHAWHVYYVAMVVLAKG